MPYCLLPSCKRLKTFNDWFWKKCRRTLIFDIQSPLIPGLGFSSKLRLPLTSCKVSEKLMNGLCDIQRRTNGRTDNGYFYGPYRVNSGPKCKNQTSHQKTLVKYQESAHFYHGILCLLNSCACYRTRQSYKKHLY